MRKFSFSLLASLSLSFSLLSAATLNVPGTYSTIQLAVNAANPGDTVLVAAGTYTGWRATLASGLQRSGTLGNPITVMGVSPSVATATYVSGLTVAGTGACALTNFRSVSQYGSGTTANLNITGGAVTSISITAGGTGYTWAPTTAAVGACGGSASATGTLLIASTLSAAFITAPNSDGNGVTVNALNYYTIENFIISAMNPYAITAVSCTGCQILSNGAPTNSTGISDIFTGFCYACIYYGNTVSGAGGGQHGIYVSNSAQGYVGVHIYGNEIFSNSGNGIQINGDCQTPNSLGQTVGVINGALVENNYFWSNGGNGLSLINMSNSLVRNNVIVNNGTSSPGGNIKLADQGGCNAGANYNTIVNNTIVALPTTAAGIRVVNNTNGSAFVGNVIFNNIILSNTYKCVIDSTAANCDSAGDGGAYYTPTYEGTSTSPVLFVNPVLTGPVSNWNIASGSSPVVGAGIANTTGYPSTGTYNAPVVDFQGALRSGRYDAGAYEQGASPAPPDTTPPTTPGTPTAAIGGTQIVLSWTASTDTREVLWYEILRNGAPYANTSNPSLTWTDGPYNATTGLGVQPGTTYTYAILALNGSFLYSAASGTLSVTAFGTIGCMNADVNFRYVLTPNEAGNYTVAGTATPFASSTTDAFVYLSPGIPTNFSSLANIIAFSSSGVVQVRNGGTYQADATYPWTSGTTYNFTITGNVGTHLYSVSINTGGAPTALATNYAWRTEQSLATSIGYMGVTDDYASGSLALCTPSVNGLFLDGLQFVPTLVQNLYTQVISAVNLNANGSGYPLFDTPNQPSLTGSRSLSALDRASLLTYTGSGNITVSMPAGLGAGFGAAMQQGGAGTITLVGSGITLHQFGTGNTTAGQYATLVVQCNTADNCVIWGQRQ